MSIIEWGTKFQTIVVCGTDLLPNTYDITVGLNPISLELYIQNIGFERVKFMLNVLVNNSCMVHIHNPSYAKLDKLMESTQFMTTPDEPFDQMLIVTLFHKLNAILDGYFECEYLFLSSHQGENIKYHFDAEYASDFIDEKEYFPANIKEKRLPWWLRGDASICDTLNKTPQKLAYDWDDIGLGFEDPKEEKAGEVIDISSQKKQKKSFNPQVIDGTKHIDSTE